MMLKETPNAHELAALSLFKATATLASAEKTWEMYEHVWSLNN